ncbi:MAG: VWA domain-containing protein, partial [Methylococcales bacterium]|nr:VWA domain-containing protein [Methylococcales bacterium]
MSEFHFLRPQLFLLLIPAIALLVWLWRGHHHSNVWQKVCDAPLLNYLLINKGAKQTKLPLILIGVCALLAITALAGPTYEQQQQPIFRQQTALVVVLDLSTSMLATDVSPSRLTQAKHKVLDILQRRKEGLTALVVFAGSAYTVTPLTEDTETISAMVNSLTPVMMPSQGSRPDLGLEKALELLRQGNAQQAHILIVTDGFSPKGQSQWQQTPALPYTVSMIGVGTAEGTPISKPGGGFIIDKTGKIIIPKLNAEQISELARQFSGNYYPLTLTDKDIEYTLDPFVQTKLNSELAVSDLTAEQWKEIGPILLIPILLISVLGFRRGIL